MNERIKKIRKVLGLTQQEFSERLNIGRGTLANYEVGRNEPIDAVIFLICREFNVSETWLRTGEGEIFVPKEEDPLDELVKKKNLSESDRLLIEKFLNLKPAEREVVMKYVLSVAADYAAPAVVPKEEPTTDYAAEARAEAEEYYREILEEKRQVAGESASSASNETKPA